MQGFFQSQAIGNLGRDPEMSVTQDGTKVCRFSIAINRKRRGEEAVDWVSVTAFNKLAELANQYLRKGGGVFINGTTEVRKYQGRDGQEKTSVELLAHDIKFLSKNDDRSQSQPEPGGSFSGPTTDDDIPF